MQELIKTIIKTSETSLLYTETLETAPLYIIIIIIIYFVYIMKLNFSTI